MDLPTFIDFATKGGITATLVFILYFVLKKIFEHFSKTSTSENDVLMKLIEQNAKQNQDNFTLLKDMIGLNMLQNDKIDDLKVVIIQKTDDIKHLILNNTWCPYYRELVKNNEEDKTNG